jgi:hypothetical protein
MSLKQKYINTRARGRAPRAKKDFWHRIPKNERVAVLGSVSVILFGYLYSLMFTGAAGSWVGFQVLGSGSGFTINLIAIPEKRARVIAGQNNSGTLLTVEVRDPGTTTALFSGSLVTSSGGTYNGWNVSLSPGTYDITAKGYSHLRTKKSSVVLDTDVTVDFTNNGASPLLCGDTDENERVNGLDLSLIVGGLATYDLKYDMDRNGVINGLDLTHAVSNINLTGAT